MSELAAPHILLKQAREKRGLTQAEVAERIGVDTGTISRWERAEVKPRPQERVQLAEQFGIPTEAWVNQNEEIDVIREEQFLRPLHEDEQPYPKIWTVPIKISFFIGRQDILLRLHEALLTGKTTALTQVISGLGGIGKTLTAARYAYMHRNQYKAVFWIEADTPNKLKGGLLKMAQDLNLPEKRHKDPELIIAAVKRWMKEQAHWLLILDNVEDIASIHELLPSARRGHVLLTTRTQATGHAIINIELIGLPQEEGALLLLQRAGRLTEIASLEQANVQERELAKSLSFLMEGLPLALEQAGAYIREQECSLSEYLEWYKSRRAYLLSWRSSQHPDGVYEYPHSVATTWSLSFEKIHQNSPAAVDLLSFYAFLDPEVIPEELMITAASELGPHLNHISDSLEFSEILAHLRRYSFVRRDRDQRAVNIHRVVQAVFKDHMDKETQKYWAERTVRAMYKALIKLKDMPLVEQDRYFSHAQHCYNWIIEWSFRFSEAEFLLLLLGDYASKRMLYSQAKEYFLQAIAITEVMHSPTHVQKAVAYNHIAALYEEMGEYSNADTFFRKAVEIFEKNPSPEMKILLARALNNLAGNQEKLNNLVEAEQNARRAVEIMKQTKGASDHDIELALNTLEIILYRLNRQEEAEQVAHQINAISHPERESDLVRAKMLENQGEKQHPIQIDLIEQALVLYQRVYGQEHTDIAHCLISIGAGYFERKNYIFAKSYYQQAMDMYIHMNFTEHNDFVVILTQMGLSCLFLNEMKEASTFFDRAREAAQKNPSPYVDTQMLDTFSSAAKKKEKPW